MDYKKKFLAIKCTPHNTILQATISENKNIIVSTGTVGFKGGKRSAPYAAQKAAEAIGIKLLENRVKKIFLIFSGFGYKKSKKFIIKGLKNKKIKIFKIVYKTSIPHNGCRTKRKPKTRG